MKCSNCTKENDTPKFKRCSSCRAHKREYDKKWRKANPDKIKAYTKKYREALYDTMTEIEMKVYHKEKNDASKAYHAEYRKRPEVIARQKAYHAEYVKCEYGRQVKREANQRNYWNKKNASKTENND